MSSTKRRAVAALVFVLGTLVATPLVSLGFNWYSNSVENVEAHQTQVLSTRREGGGKSTTRYWVKFRMEDDSVKNMNFTTAPGAQAGQAWTVYTYNFKHSPDRLSYWPHDPRQIPTGLIYLFGALGGVLFTTTFLAFVPSRLRRNV